MVGCRLGASGGGASRRGPRIDAGTSFEVEKDSTLRSARAALRDGSKRCWTGGLAPTIGGRHGLGVEAPAMTPEPTEASRSLMDVLFEQAGVGLCLVGSDGIVVRANAEWLRSTGYTADEAIGADIIELFPETRDMALAMHARARAGHWVQVPSHAQRVNGHETW